MNQLNKFKLQSLNGSFQDVPKSSILPRKARGSCNGVAVFDSHNGHLSEEFIVPHTPKARNLDFQSDSIKRATIIIDVNKIQSEELFSEQFSGWGYEDTFFVQNIYKNHGPIARVNVHCFHLNHERISSFYNKSLVQNNAKLHEKMMAELRCVQFEQFTIDPNDPFQMNNLRTCNAI